MPKKILASSMKDEAPFVVEWLAYYKVLGFDEFHIAYNKSNDNTEELLKALEAAGELTTYENTLKFSKSPQGNAGIIFNKAKIVDDGDWVFWPDTDEFLNIHLGNKKLDDLLEYLDAENCDTILVQWRIFGDSGQSGIPERMIDYGMVGASAPDMWLSRSIKAVWKSSSKFSGFGVESLHRPLVNTSAQSQPRAILSNGDPIRPNLPPNAGWLMGDDDGGNHWASRQPGALTLAQLNHYSVKSRDSLMLKRVRGRGWAPEGSDERHTDEFYKKYNRNECVDDSILLLLPELNHEIDRLMALPGVAQLHNDARKDALSRVHKLRYDSDTKPESPPFIPNLTLPQDAGDFLRECLTSSQAYLEYGSGGSTILSLEKDVADIFSVECDVNWAEKVEQFVSEKKLGSPGFRMHKVYIGPVKSWARPKNRKFARHFGRYPNSVWSRHDFVHPDLVLIDGRFRVACFVACALNAQKPARILFDDYLDRPYYHIVEEIVRPTQLVGRMAVFDIKPNMLTKAESERFAEFYGDPS